MSRVATPPSRRLPALTECAHKERFFSSSYRVSSSSAFHVLPAPHLPLQLARPPLPALPPPLALVDLLAPFFVVLGLRLVPFIQQLCAQLADLGLARVDLSFEPRYYHGLYCGPQLGHGAGLREGEQSKYDAGGHHDAAVELPCEQWRV